MRHGGYIPWDDDFDIYMLRDDYERFFEIAPKEMPSVYIFLSLRDIEEGYDNFLSYLLIDETSHILNGEISLNKLDLINEKITTNKSDYKYIISKASNEDRYLSGFYYENNNFFIYYKYLLNNDDPFIGVGDQLINNTSPLYDYYRGLFN